MKGRSRTKAPAYHDWLNNYRVASAWISKHDVEGAVDAAGGLVRIENFLPEFVAEGILSIVEAVPDGHWKDTSAKEDYTQNNISHSFSSVKQAEGLDAVTRLFSLVRPGALNAFSAAKYCKSDHIDPHDDRAYTQVRLDSGRVITTSRTLAVIYYLTRDWREEYGGVLLDLEDPKAKPGTPVRYVPRWNSVVAFRVPRYHAVTPMTINRPRYSIFGWFLEPGKLYPLYRGAEDERKALPQQRKQGQKQSEQKQKLEEEPQQQELRRQQQHGEAPAKRPKRGRQEQAEQQAEGGAASKGPQDGPGPGSGGPEEAGPGQGPAAGHARKRQRQLEQEEQQSGGKQGAAAGTRRTGSEGQEAAAAGRRGLGVGGSSGGGDGGGGAGSGGGGGENGAAAGSKPRREALAAAGAKQGAAAGEDVGEEGAGGAGPKGRLAAQRPAWAAARLPGRWQGRRKHMCVR